MYTNIYLPRQEVYSSTMRDSLMPPNRCTLSAIFSHGILKKFKIICFVYEVLKRVTSPLVNVVTGKKVTLLLRQPN
jgi:hypothetical protein